MDLARYFGPKVDLLIEMRMQMVLELQIPYVFAKLGVRYGNSFLSSYRQYEMSTRLCLHLLELVYYPPLERLSRVFCLFSFLNLSNCWSDDPMPC